VIPASDIDKLLLSFCDVRWLKVARIIGKAIQTFESRGVRVAADEFDARMAILVAPERWKPKETSATGGIAKFVCRARSNELTTERKIILHAPWRSVQQPQPGLSP